MLHGHPLTSWRSLKDPRIRVCSISTGTGNKGVPALERL